MAKKKETISPPKRKLLSREARKLQKGDPAAGRISRRGGRSGSSEGQETQEIAYRRLIFRTALRESSIKPHTWVFGPSSPMLGRDTEPGRSEKRPKCSAPASTWPAR